ncbi:hypothetical protein HMPREF0277_1291 [Corynebacterium accolens ATCC 49726]|nr:hypothetical protein HMPREF0277_1291 [Corynebacterium accolens ATCC 49726]
MRSRFWATKRRRGRNPELRGSRTVRLRVFAACRRARFFLVICT